MQKRGTHSEGYKHRRTPAVGFAELSSSGPWPLLVRFIAQEGLLRGDGKKPCSRYNRQLYEDILRALDIKYGVPLLYRGGPGSDRVVLHNGRLADALARWNLSRLPREGGGPLEEKETDQHLRDGAGGVREFWRFIRSGDDAQSRIYGIGDCSSDVIDRELRAMGNGDAAPPTAPAVYPLCVPLQSHICSHEPQICSHELKIYSQDPQICSQGLRFAPMSLRHRL